MVHGVDVQGAETTALQGQLHLAVLSLAVHVEPVLVRGAGHTGQLEGEPRIGAARVAAERRVHHRDLIVDPATRDVPARDREVLAHHVDPRPDHHGVTGGRGGLGASREPRVLGDPSLELVDLRAFHGVAEPALRAEAVVALDADSGVELRRVCQRHESDDEEARGGGRQQQTFHAHAGVPPWGRERSEMSGECIHGAIASTIGRTARLSRYAGTDRSGGPPTRSSQPSTVVSAAATPR